MNDLYIILPIVAVTAAIFLFLIVGPSAGNYWKRLGKKPSEPSAFDHLRRGGGDKKD